MFTRCKPQFALIGIAILLISIILIACATRPTDAPVNTPLLPTDPPVSTPLPPTDTPVSTPLPPTPQEEMATSAEQIVGEWAIRFMGGGEEDPGVLIFAEDGTFRMDATGGYHAGMNLGMGTFRFEGDLLILESDICARDDPSDRSVQFFTCTAQYQAFVSAMDGKSGQLHLVAVDDPFEDRRKTLDGKTFKPYTD